jgi:hypothetical protein
MQSFSQRSTMMLRSLRIGYHDSMLQRQDSHESLPFRRSNRWLTRMSRLILPRAFKILTLTGPNASLPQLRPPLRLPILFLQPDPKFRTRLRFVHRRKPGPQHLKANVPPKKAPPNVNSSDDAVVLITLVDVSSDSSVEDVVL